MYLRRSYLGLIFWARIQSSAQAAECADDPTFLLAGRTGYNCDFIGKKMSQAACDSRINSAGTTVGDMCPKSCNKCKIRDSIIHHSNDMKDAPSETVPDDTQKPTNLVEGKPYGHMLEDDVDNDVDDVVDDDDDAPPPEEAQYETQGWYPDDCVDEGQHIQKLPILNPNGTYAFIDICDWVGINPTKRCDVICPCTVPIALKYHCRKTCSNCPGVPSETPSSTPSTELQILTDCTDREDVSNVYSDGEVLGLCEWTALNPDDRCKGRCPCGKDFGTLISEMCPNTCGTCMTAMPSSVPSITPTLSPSISPTVCADNQDCSVVGDVDILVPLCEYAAGDVWGRCDMPYADGLVKDYCRHTCYICRDMCVDKGSDTEVYVPASGELISICTWAVQFPSERCQAEWRGDLVSDLCEYTCGKCVVETEQVTKLPSAVPSTTPSLELTHVPSTAPSLEPSSAPTLVPSTKPTVCEDNQDCYAVPDGDRIRKLCEWANKKRCSYSSARYVTKESLPVNAGPQVKHLCRKKCKLC